MPTDPYRYFRVEARELAEQIGRGALALERDASEPGAVARILRMAHTLKGAARVVRQGEIADRAHAIEDALGPWREQADPVPRERVERVLGLADEIAARVAALGEAPARGPAAPPPGETAAALLPDPADLDDAIESLSEAASEAAGLRRALADLDRARRLSELLAEQAAGNGRGAVRTEPGPGARAGTLAAELRDLCAGIDRAVARGVERIDREVRQAREAAERLRLVPAGALFPALERAARDAARARGTTVAFAGEGGRVRLAASVLGAVQGALLQAVSNAVAHGIEPEDARAAAGKPRQGRVTVRVERRRDRVVFRCRDDGRGLDLEAVRRAAARRGVAQADTRALGPEELVALLLRGGISTSETVSELAGRGIGLDVIREVAERLGGKVAVRTAAGRGVEVELEVPPSPASLPALLVEAGGIAAAIPLDAVRRGLRLAPGEVTRAPGGERVEHAGGLIPFLPLARALPAAAPVRAERAWSAVVIEAAGGAAAIGVDRLLGAAEVVVRPLPEGAPAAEAVAGAALDARGVPRVVLDPDGLIAAARRPPGAEPEPAAPPPAVLVIDDSPTTRMVERGLLEAAGYRVDAVASGEEALELARRARYALFLVDVEMPGMDGFEFMERARADAALRDVPSVLVTSRASPEDRARGARAGARAYIVKSDFDQRELLDLIRSLIAPAGGARP